MCAFTRDDGAGVAQRLYNGLPRDGPGFDFLWERCKNRAMTRYPSYKMARINTSKA